MSEEVDMSDLIFVDPTDVGLTDEAIEALARLLVNIALEEPEN